jgi:hypothetical protein
MLAFLVHPLWLRKRLGIRWLSVAAKLCPWYAIDGCHQLRHQEDCRHCFEPSLDYVVTKMPRWDMAKFEGVSTKIGSAMKSVGEVMGIGRTLEESMQKALRMVDPSYPGFQPNMRFETMEDLKTELQVPTDKRIFAIAQALHEKTMTVPEIHAITKIDHWFLRRLEDIVKNYDEMAKVSLADMTDDLMMDAKKLGYSDVQIAGCLKDKPSEDAVRAKRQHAA